MSNELTVAPANFDTMLQETKKMQSFCNALLDTPHYKKMGGEGVFAIVQMAQTLGIDPRNALNGELYFTQGRVGMYAEAMSKYIRMKGHSIVLVELTATKCTLKGTRADNKDTANVTYTIEMARRAGLVKSGGPWEKHTEAMLWSRAMSILKKVLFSDLLATILTKEEMDDMEPKGKSKDHEIIEMEIVSDNVTEEKRNALQILLEQCPQAFIDNVTKHVNETCGSFENISQSVYDSVKKACDTKLSNLAAIAAVKGPQLVQQDLFKEETKEVKNESM